MRARYRFVATSAPGGGTHLWRLDRETGEAWHFLFRNGQEAREEIERQTGKKTSWYSEPRISANPGYGESDIARWKEDWKALHDGRRTSREAAGTASNQRNQGKECL